MTLNDLGVIFGMTLTVEKSPESLWKARFDTGVGLKLMVRRSIGESRWEPIGSADTPSGACRSLANELSFKNLLVPIIPRSPEGGATTSPRDWNPRLLGDPGGGDGAIVDVALMAKDHDCQPYLRVDLPEVFHVEPPPAPKTTHSGGFPFRVECDLKDVAMGTSSPGGVLR